MSARRRPVSVSVIAWLLTAAGSLSVIFAPILLLIGQIPEVREAWRAQGISGTQAAVSSLIGGAVTILCGVGMLFGRNWARILYLVIGPAGLIVGWLMNGFRPTSILSVIFYLVVVFFLVRRDAVEYFTGSEPAQAPPEAPASAGDTESAPPANQ
ncbi:MAG: hypothetical protein Q7T82_06265 [Armatimonadota bacterium]|nr:hypothetical protein [Armatimonadota bacterium]